MKEATSMSSSSVIPNESESSMDENTDSSSLPHDTNTSTSASTSSVTQSENQVACPEIEAPITLPNASWKNISTRPLQCITLCKISSVPTVSMQPDMQPVIITHCLTIDLDTLCPQSNMCGPGVYTRNT